jgi:ABC-type uncharacterized transport system substrate-binding protein
MVAARALASLLRPGALSSLVLPAVIALLVCSTALAAGVEVLLSEDAGAYREIAEVLRQELQGRVLVSVAESGSAEDGTRGATDAELVIAVGGRALSAALASGKAPVLATLVPRASYEAIVGRSRGDPRKVSAIYIDQPFARQLQLVRLVLPGKERAGVLVSPGGEGGLRVFRSVAQQQGFSVAAETVGSQDGLYSALQQVLAASDFVLAVPDPNVYSAATIHNILLTTFRAQRPLFGFSPAYVRAGALAAVYSTPPKLAQEVAGVARRVLAGGAMPPPRYPSTFSVSVNWTVARSLGLRVEDASVLEEKLSASERER